MQSKNKFITAIKIVGIATVASLAMPVFAESAPVYDADAMQQSPQPFEGGLADSGQDLPMPPPPGQESAFVPAPRMMPGPTVSNDQRIKRMEQQLAALQSTNVSARADSLQKEVQALRGQVEQLTHKLQTLDSQQKSQYTDLDKRMSQQLSADKTTKPAAKPIETAANDTQEPVASKPLVKVAAAKTETPKVENDQPNVAEEQEIYQKAYNLIKDKKYDEAVKVLQGMLAKYPSGQFASNAHYWLGELYGLLGKHDQALDEFDTVVKTYPDSPRLPDAQLKIGLIYAAKLNWTDAKKTFKKVINTYPGTASSRLAAEQLKQIKQAGH